MYACRRARKNAFCAESVAARRPPDRPTPGTAVVAGHRAAVARAAVVVVVSVGRYRVQQSGGISGKCHGFTVRGHRRPRVADVVDDATDLRVQMLRLVRVKVLRKSCTRRVPPSYFYF